MEELNINNTGKYPQRIQDEDIHQPQVEHQYEYHQGSSSYSNCPKFLIDPANQQLYGFIAISATFVTGGVLGLLMSVYYLFVLNDAVEKDTVAKRLNWIAFWLPLVLIVLALILILPFSLSQSSGLRA